MRIDPGELLGLQWHDAYLDMCLLYGMRHGSQIFQRLIDAVRYVMYQRGFFVIDYIDDYVRLGAPDVAYASYDCLPSSTLCRI